MLTTSLIKSRLMSKMMGLARLYTQNALRFQNVPFFLFFHIGLIWGNPQFKKKNQSWKRVWTPNTRAAGTRANQRHAEGGWWGGYPGHPYGDWWGDYPGHPYDIYIEGIRLKKKYYTTTTGVRHSNQILGPGLPQASSRHRCCPQRDRETQRKSIDAK